MTSGGDGMPIINYYDSTNGALKVVHYERLLCSILGKFELHEDGNVGRCAAPTIGLDDLSLIDYAIPRI